MRKIQTKEREIKKLMNLERQFVNRLQSTLSFEDDMHRDLESIKKLRSRLMQINDLEQLDQFIDVYGVNLCRFNKPSPRKRSKSPKSLKRFRKMSRRSITLNNFNNEISEENTDDE